MEENPTPETPAAAACSCNCGVKCNCSRYPQWVVLAVALLALVVATAAFVLAAFFDSTGPAEQKYHGVPCEPGPRQPGMICPLPPTDGSGGFQPLGSEGPTDGTGSAPAN